MQTQVPEVKETMGQGGGAPAADQDRTTSPSTLRSRQARQGSLERQESPTPSTRVMSLTLLTV